MAHGDQRGLNPGLPWGLTGKFQGFQQSWCLPIPCCTLLKQEQLQLAPASFRDMTQHDTSHQHHQHASTVSAKDQEMSGGRLRSLGAKLLVTGSWSNCGHRLSYRQSCVRWSFRWFKLTLLVGTKQVLSPAQRSTQSDQSSQATGVLRWLEGHTTHPAVVTRLWQSDWSWWHLMTLMIWDDPAEPHHPWRMRRKQLWTFHDPYH